MRRDSVQSRVRVVLTWHIPQYWHVVRSELVSVCVILWSVTFTLWRLSKNGRVNLDSRVLLYLNNTVTFGVHQFRCTAVVEYVTVREGL